MKVFTGIGSRKTPTKVLYAMKEISCKLAESGYILRSGGADGADTAFELGFDECNTGQEKEIYLPWPKFNNNSSLLHTPLDKAFEITYQFHPNPSALSKGAAKIHARNVHQVLGRDLSSPSNFIIYWSRGTLQALRIAEYYEIPIYNLRDNNHLKQLKEFLKE